MCFLFSDPKETTGDDDHAAFHTPPPAQVKKTPAFYKCARRLREMNLDDLGFEVNDKTTDTSFLVNSPCKRDGSVGRTYHLGSDQLRLRAAELDNRKVSKCMSCRSTLSRYWIDSAET